MNKRMEILELLTKIPKGKVTTYGALAKKVKTSPRAIGQIMRRNEWPDKFPCYKVISASGKIHGYDGCMSGRKHEKKINLLKKDGIQIKDGKIDLGKHFYSF